MNPHALADDPNAFGPQRLSPVLENRFDAMRRGWRVVLPWMVIAILALFGLAIVIAAWITAFTGRPMPDFFTGLLPILTFLVPLALEQINRHLERKAGMA